jgi:hypothetical protein
VKGFDACLAFLSVGREPSATTSEPPEDAATMMPSEHPASEILGRFVLGRLDRGGQVLRRI